MKNTCQTNGITAKGAEDSKCAAAATHKFVICLRFEQRRPPEHKKCDSFGFLVFAIMHALIHASLVLQNANASENLLLSFKSVSASWRGPLPAPGLRATINDVRSENAYDSASPNCPQAPSPHNCLPDCVSTQTYTI